MEFDYFMRTLENIETITFILKILFLSMCSYYTFSRIINGKNFSSLKILGVLVFNISISIICGILRYSLNYFSSLICLILLLSFSYSKFTKNKLNNSIIITIISLGINYAIFFISVIICFLPNVIFRISNDYINLILITILHMFLLNFIFKLKKFNKGLIFLQNNITNETFHLFTLNLSIAILFLSITLNNFNIIIAPNLILSLIILTILTFITIQKTLTMYYKHNLLVKELNDTKQELENKKKEIAELEKENLNFSKISHSIAHKQKALEYKLNELMQNGEIHSKIDISNNYFNTIHAVELSKTNILKVDDMLNYMQSECIKNNINFELKLNGNIYPLINNLISEESLEILLADLIKNSIVAINNSDNINRSILVTLGIKDRFYTLSIYDSGIEFQIETLCNLGQKPCSTHLNDGGTGMGFMNIFDTLYSSKSSLIITEFNKPSKDNYTKSITIIFDNKNEYIVSSYRSDIIKENNNNNNNLIILS